MPSPISGQNPEIKPLTDGQQPPVTNSAPVQNQSSAGIFRVGLTRSEASLDENLNSLFKKYNTDENDIISEDEFKSYANGTEPVQEEVTANEQEQEITTGSEKRTAVGGVYTVKEGDKLADIAKDFGMTTEELYQANAEIIGESAEVALQSGQELKVKETKVEDKQPVKKARGRRRHGKAKAASAETAAQEVQNEKRDQLFQAFGIDLNNDNIQELFAKMKTLSDDEKHKIMDGLVGIYVDFDKVDQNLVEQPLDDIAISLGISEEAWLNADWNKKGSLLAEKMNQMYKADLDDKNPDSAYNKELERISRGEITDRERELYGEHFDFDNLTVDDKAKLAQLAVTQKYVSTSLAIAHHNIENGKNDAFASVFSSYMKSMFSSQDTINFLMFIGGQHKNELSQYLAELSNQYIEHYQGEDSDDSFQALALGVVAEYADMEYLMKMYQNNPDMKDTLDEVLKVTAENTTDETRRAMLNNIADNSEQIIQGNSSVGGKGGSTGGAYATNPVQMSQIDRIAAMKLQSANFHSQANPISEIPDEFKAHFQTIQEYRDFKANAKGMTAAEYRHTQHLIKNNFTSAMNEIIGNYTNLPDKFKPKVLSFFDAMDFNTSSELYLNGNVKLRTFMDKYHYMTPSILLAHVTTHPGELNQAPEDVKQMLEEFKAQQKYTPNQGLARLAI